MSEDYHTPKKEAELQFYKQVGNNIRDARKRAGLTQEDLAYILDISRVSVNNIEMGKQRLPVHLISGIANLFKLYIHEIVPFYDYGIKSLSDLYEFKETKAKQSIASKITL